MMSRLHHLVSYYCSKWILILYTPLYSHSIENVLHSNQAYSRISFHNTFTTCEYCWVIKTMYERVFLTIELKSKRLSMPGLRSLDRTELAISWSQEKPDWRNLATRRSRSMNSARPPRCRFLCSLSQHWLQPRITLLSLHSSKIQSCTLSVAILQFDPISKIEHQVLTTK